MKNNPLLTIAILNRNGLERLKKVVPSYLGQTYSPLEIVVLDNGSNDGSVSFLEHFSKIRIIKNSFNEGYGAAKNRLVADSKGEYILLLDNDIELTNQTFVADLFSIYLKNQIKGFISPLVKDVDKNYLDSIGLYFNKIQRKISLGEIDNLGTFKIPAYRGNTVFFKKDIFHKLGGFDEKYPFNIDDYDLSARAYLSGYFVYATSECLAIHHGVETRIDPKALAWRYKYYLAGFSRTIWKNYKPLNIVIWWPVSVLWIFFKALRIALVVKNPSPIFSYMKSIFIFCKDFPDTLKIRSRIQSARTVSQDLFLDLKYPKV